MSSNLFVLKDEILTLKESLKTFDECTDTLLGFAKKAVEDGVTNRFMGEN